MRNENYVLILIISSLAVSLIFNLIFNNVFEYSVKVNSTDEIINKCSNLELRGSVSCVVNMADNFYNYTDTTNNYYDIDSLKLYGGDCYNWALFYDDIFKKLGFYTEMPIIDIDDYQHTFNIVSNSDGYCIIESQNIKCWEIKK